MKKIFYIILVIQACSPNSLITDYKEVPIIYDDVRNLGQVLNKYSENEINKEVVQKEYFDKGTPGLIDLIRKDNLTAKAYSAFLKKNYGFIKSVCNQVEYVESDSTRLRGLLKKYSEMFPSAKYQPVYFLIGQNYHGGTVTKSGFVIEIQLNALGLKDIDLNFQDTSRMSRFENIDQTFIHEQVHVSREEQYLSGSLIRMTVDEGSCDYISFLITGKKGNQETYFYGDKHFEELKSEWKEDINQDVKNTRHKWVWNWGQKSERPPDLGYYIGYKISESYIQNSTDTENAYLEILEMKNYEDFYEKSGF